MRFASLVGGKVELHPCVRLLFDQFQVHTFYFPGRLMLDPDTEQDRWDRPHMCDLFLLLKVDPNFWWKMCLCINASSLDLATSVKKKC